MSTPLHWSARLGGMWLVFPHSITSKDMAKMLRTSAAKAKLTYDTTPGLKHERVAKILLRAATGRIVPIEDIRLSAATDAELELWRSINHAHAVVKGDAPEAPVEQPSLWATP